ncbi:MAG: RNA repair domain-containing protein [Candidatus Odinarchaeum yellowstonii]|uniref:UPF0248 protein OdinLCB4_004625 n=1 Tax=Odinarchaeota yellowstonii (strain LCB_4) TaxID=1841599 RepID=A0AAF0D3J4_ODILC|nr:MAG: RNA repair domain-containing protein [Candidatus Odinarchaeum yellowstonii]
MRLKDLFNKLRWAPQFKNKIFKITYIHRGAPNDVQKITSDRINQICSSYFTYTNSSGEEVVIPYHRIITVIDEGSGEVLWVKRGYKAGYD